MGFPFFRERLRRVFQKNKFIQDSEHISNLIKQGKYVLKELEVSFLYDMTILCFIYVPYFRQCTDYVNIVL